MGKQYCYYCMNELPEGQNVCSHCNCAVGYVAPVHHIRPGTIMNNRFYVGKALGQGGFGITYIGRDLMLDMRVAIKEYFPNGLSNRNNTHTNIITFSEDSQGRDYDKDMQRYLDEARILAKFSDDSGIVNVRDFFRENGTAYIVMEYLDGRNLREYLEQEGNMAPNELFEKLEPVMISLHKIHKEQLVHRDISPDNIMMLKDGRLKLLDFGAARTTTGDRSLSVVLKHGYAPEEQYRTKGNQGPWTDVYAMSATIYKCLTGITPPQSLERAIDDELMLPSSMGIPISPTQEQALMKGLSVRIRDRIQSMEELRCALWNREEAEKIHHITVESGPQKDPEKTIYEPSHSERGRKVVGYYRHSVEEDTNATIYDPKPDPNRWQTSETDRRDQDELRNEKRSLSNVAQKRSPSNVAQKKSKKTLLWIGGALLLVAAFVVGLICLLPGSESSAPRTETPDIEVNAEARTKYEYVLENVGTISDPERLLKEKSGVVYIDDEQGRVYLSFNGTELAKNLKAAEYLGSDVYAILDNSGSVGLVNKDGELLIPCKAARIELLGNYSFTSDRFLMVKYITGTTTDEKYAFLKEKQCGVLGALGTGDTLYTGYAMIYDLQQKDFVKTPAITSTAYNAIYPCGDSLLIMMDDGSYALYGSDGTVLFSTSRRISSVGKSTFVVSDSGTYRIYDSVGQQLYVSNRGITGLGNDCDYYMGTQEDDTYVLMDGAGNQLLSIVADGMGYLGGDYFYYEKDDKEVIFRLENDQIIELLPPAEYGSAEILAGEYLGIYLNDTHKHDHLILDHGGTVLETDDFHIHESLTSVQDGMAFVLNDATYSLPIDSEYPERLHWGILASESKTNGMYGIYDLFTGNQLLPHDIEKVIYAGEHLYVYKDACWNIYSMTLKPIT